VGSNPTGPHHFVAPAPSRQFNRLGNLRFPNDTKYLTKTNSKHYVLTGIKISLGFLANFLEKFMIVKPKQAANFILDMISNLESERR
jgi:hypothetical protein